MAQCGALQASPRKHFANRCCIVMQEALVDVGLQQEPDLQRKHNKVFLQLLRLVFLFLTWASADHRAET